MTDFLYHQGQTTLLKEGDIITWLPEQHTYVFWRNEVRMRIGNDDCLYTNIKPVELEEILVISRNLIMVSIANEGVVGWVLQSP